MGAIVLGLAGCSSAALPPPLSPADRALVESTRFPATVGVAPTPDRAESELLIAVLRSTGLFSRVAALAELGAPDLIARLERAESGARLPAAPPVTVAVVPVPGGSGPPVVPVVGVGLMPATARREWGDVVSLHAPGGRGAPLLVDATYTGVAAAGWVAPLLNLSPRRCAGDPRRTARYRAALAAALARQAPAIHRMLAAGRGLEEDGHAPGQ
jgi:hypothetical protein